MKTPQIAPLSGMTPLGFKPVTLHSYTREQLESYMTDCHAFDKEQLAEWKNKQDLISDIKSFGWEANCLEYLA